MTNNFWIVVYTNMLGEGVRANALSLYLQKHSQCHHPSVYLTFDYIETSVTLFQILLSHFLFVQIVQHAGGGGESFLSSRC